MIRVITAAFGLMILSCADHDLIAPSNHEVIPPSVSTSDSDREGCIFILVESWPVYSGGVEEMWAIIHNNLVCPSNFRCVDGSVFVAFTVNEDGSLSDFEIVRGLGSPFDERALDVVRQMPDWSPGLQNGLPVRTKMVLPIKFTL